MSATKKSGVSRKRKPAPAPETEAMQTTVPEAWISVEMREGIIHARYAGSMTLELVQRAGQRIRELIPSEGKARILYDTRHMLEPERELSRWMLGFDEEIRARVAKAATLAPSMMVEAQARAAFVNSPEHEFFHELEPALAWLKS